MGDNTKKVAKALGAKTECGSCYGAKSLREDGCCNTCQEVREAYVKSGWGMVNVHIIDQCIAEGWMDRVEKRSNEGCNVFGNLLVNKVRGNFHFAPGEAFQTSSMHIHDLKEFSDGAPDGHKFDLSHTIHKLKFGPDTKYTTDDIAAVTNALAGTTKNADQGKFIELMTLSFLSSNYYIIVAARVMYQYFLKIVSTRLEPINDIPTFTNQFSVTQNDIIMTESMSGLPGAFFNIDISPMQITYKESRKSFGSFLTSVLAIVGGVFTVAGLIDRVVYKAEKAYKKKLEMGKTL